VRAAGELLLELRDLLRRELKGLRLAGARVELGSKPALRARLRLVQDKTSRVACDSVRPFRASASPFATFWQT
jgi:hypothetical protein